MLSLDAFVAHLTDGVEVQLLESNLDIRPIPAGCTSKCQPMDVSINKPFKTVLRRRWVKYFAGAVEGFPNANGDTTFELTVTTRQDMIERVKEGFDYLVQDQVMLKKSIKFAALPHRIQIKCGMVPFSNSAWERHCTIWRPMTLMKLMIFFSFTNNIWLWNW